MMKSQRGVTLAGLIMYVIAMTVIVGIIGTITSFFYSNIENMNESATNLGEFNKFNVAFLEEVKKAGNSVYKIDKDGTRITFSSGTVFTFQDAGVYQDRIKICKGVTNCRFSTRKQEEKEIVTVLIEIGKKVPYAKTVEYVMSYENITANSNLESDYSQATTENYVQNGLQIHYDAINNTGEGHSNTTTTWRDLSPNHYDGILKNFSYEEESGWSNNSLRFDGSDDGVFLQDYLKDLFKSGNTIEVLIEFDESNARDIIIGNYNNVGAINYEKASSSELTNKFRAYINMGDTDIMTTNELLKINEKQILTITFDKDNKVLNVYQNSELKQSISIPKVSTYSIDWLNVWIGIDVRSGTTALKGKIYSVRIYNRVLIDTEIARNYEIDKARYGI